MSREVPDSWPLPPRGELRARAQTGFMGGAWLVYNHIGRIVRLYGDAFKAARHVNQRLAEDR